MTRRQQKIEERHTLELLLAALAITPSWVDDQGERPDFIITVDGQSVGVEVTTYQSGGTLGNGIERRQVEAEWEAFRGEAHAFRDARPHLRDANVGVMFIGALPLRREWLALMHDIEALIASGVSPEGPNHETYRPHQVTTPSCARARRAARHAPSRYAPP